MSFLYSRNYFHYKKDFHNASDYFTNRFTPFVVLQSYPFNELHKVKINDEIEIETTKGIFKYKITEKFDTEAENTSVLTQDMSKKEITLVTCTNGGKKRLIIKGEIME